MEFKKVELSASRPGSRGEHSISIIQSSKSIRVSTQLAKDANITEGDRFDLYRCGDIFLLKKEKVGVIRVTVSESAGTYLKNVDAYYTLISVCKTSNIDRLHIPAKITEEGILIDLSKKDKEVSSNE